ncbi:MAG: hypothetical protein VB085_13460 [Peptococcaceae bacterium]|nr:hypothetical protein [Peptococcaceae bacterium]
MQLSNPVYPDLAAVIAKLDTLAASAAAIADKQKRAIPKTAGLTRVFSGSSPVPTGSNIRILGHYTISISGSYYLELRLIGLATNSEYQVSVPSGGGQMGSGGMPIAGYPYVGDIAPGTEINKAAVFTAGIATNAKTSATAEDKTVNNFITLDAGQKLTIWCTNSVSSVELWVGYEVV